MYWATARHMEMHGYCRWTGFQRVYICEAPGWIDIISSYIQWKIQTLSFPTFGLTWSVWGFIDPRNWVVPHKPVVSHSLTLRLLSLNQNCTLSQIPIRFHRRCSRVMMMGPLLSSCIISPQCSDVCWQLSEASHWCTEASHMYSEPFRQSAETGFHRSYVCCCGTQTHCPHFKVLPWLSSDLLCPLRFFANSPRCT